MKIRLFSLLGLVIIYILSNICGFVLNIRSNRFFTIFHFAGGLLTALFFFSFFNNYLFVLILTVVTGVFWEVYEWLLWKYVLKKKQFKPERQDTINDIIVDILGAIVALLLLFVF